MKRAIRQFLALGSRIGLHAVIVAMFAAGSAAAVALLAVTLVSSRSSWTSPIEQLGRSLALPFLPAALIAFFLMPPFRQFRRSKYAREDQRLPDTLSVLMLVLAILAAWQIPKLATWWDESLRIVQQVRGDGSDPLGLWVFPAAAVVGLPVIVTSSVVVAGLMLATVTMGPPALSFGTLTGCAVLQTGLVLGGTLLLNAERRVYATVLSMMATSPSDRIPAAVTEAINRQDNFAAAVLPWLQWIAVGYWLLVAVAWELSPDVDPDDAAAAAVSGPPIPPNPGGGDPVAAGSRSVMGARTTPSTTDTSVFPRDSYVVRLQTSWLAAAFRVGNAEYTIAPIPALRGDARFSYSQASGALRREPGGPELLLIQPETHGLMTRCYAVRDRASGNTLATFERDGRNWDVLDADGQPVVHVEESEVRSGFRRYVASVDGRKVCQYTWAMQGLGVWTAELEVEFVGPGVPGFDRSVAMALAPLLEQHARRDSQRDTA